MRFRVVLVCALALVSVTACNRGRKAPPPAQHQQPAATHPMPPKPDSAQLAAQKAAQKAAAEKAAAQKKAMAAKTKPAPPAHARPAGKLYTVQVAAFMNADSARKWTGRLSSQGLPAWTTVYQMHGRTFHRVRVGATPTIAAARKLGAMLKKRYSWPVWIAPVNKSDALPNGAVQATQRILKD